MAAVDISKVPITGGGRGWERRGSQADAGIVDGGEDNGLGDGSVGDQGRQPDATVRLRPGLNLMIAPGAMVSVTPGATVTLPVMKCSCELDHSWLYCEIVPLLGLEDVSNLDMVVGEVLAVVNDAIPIA